MKITKIITITFTIFVSCNLFFTSCNKPVSEKALRLGYMPNVTHATALVGIEKNIFQNELGRDILFKPEHFIVGNSVIDAFITNQIDVAYVGPGPFINALYRKVPVKLLANAANGGTVIVGEVPGLRFQDGLRIAVPQYGNTQDLILRKYLEENNLSGKVTIISIPSQDTATAFFTMSIDAACLPEPWGTIWTEKKICKLPVDEKDILNKGNYPVTLLVVNKNYADEHPELVDKFLQAHKLANEFIVKNPNEAIEVVTNAIAKISKKQIDSKTIAKSINKCSFKNDLDLNILKEFKTIGIKSGYYRKEFLIENNENNPD